MTSIYHTVAYGISLGNTNYTLSNVFSGTDIRITIVENDYGGFQNSGIVSFFEGECLVGDSAKRRALGRPDTTYYDILKLIGKNTKEDNIEFAKHLSYPILINEGDGRIRLPFKLEGYNIKEPLFPEHMLSIILNYLYNYSQKRTVEKVNDVVLTVPFDFNNNQRRSAEVAGRIAGFNVLDVIDDPIAIAIAYAWKREQKTKEKVMIFDFGGSSLTVSIVEIDEFKFTVVGSTKDDSIGGKEIDREMFEIISNKFKEKYQIDVNDLRIREDISLQAEIKKKALSQRSIINCLCDGKSVNITKEIFDRVVSGLRDRMIQPMEAVLRNTGLTKNEIDRVIMAGGSSNIYKVQSIVSEFMERESFPFINPCEIASIGAAFYAGYMKNEIHNIPKIQISNVTQRNFGIGVFSRGQRTVQWLLKKGEELPCNSERLRVRGNVESDEIVLSIFSGSDAELTSQKDCRQEGRVSVSDPDREPNGAPFADVELKATKDGVELLARSGAKEKHFWISANRDDAFGEDEIERMKKDVEELMKYHGEDEMEEEEEKKPAKKFSSYILSTKGKKEICGRRKISSLMVNRVAKKYRDWASKNKNASQAEVDEKLEELKAEIKDLK